jgi:hypothetical protein
MGPSIDEVDDDEPPHADSTRANAKVDTPPAPKRRTDRRSTTRR